MKIMNLYPDKIVSKNATDYLYKYDIEILCNKHGIDFYSAKSFKIYFISNFYIVLSFFLRKTFFFKWILEKRCYWTFKRKISLNNMDLSDVDIIFTNNLIPNKKTCSKIILEADFVPYGSTEDIVKKIESQLYISDTQLDIVDKIVVRSQESVTVLRERSKSFSEKCVIIPHYLPYLEAISGSDFCEKWGVIARLKMVFVGNQAKRKGIDLLISLYKSNKKYFDSRFDISIVSNFTDGEVDLPKEFKIFKGASRDDVFSILKESHFFILPTKEEAFGKVFVESMAAGCIPLIPNMYPLTSYFDGGGVFVDFMDESMLLKKINSLILSRDKLFQSASRSLNYFNSNYSKDVVEKKYIDLFKEVCLK